MENRKMAFDYDIEMLARRKAEMGMLDVELARLAKVTPSTVKNVLTRKTSKAPTIRKIAEALGMNLADLVKSKSEGAPA